MGKITVSELSERAEITRGTFYNHYNNLYEVAEDLEGELEGALFSRSGKLKTVEEVDAYLDEIFNFFEQHSDLYREILRGDVTPIFLKRLEKEINTQVTAVARNLEIWTPELEMDVLFLVNGTMAIVQKHFQEEVELTLEEIRDFLKRKVREVIR